MTAQQSDRIALISALAEVSGRPIGRTALMKLLYFLESVKNVPLGYYFTLYAYGPFDSNVLADLDAAEGLGAVKSTLVRFPGAYGYEIEPAGNKEKAKARGKDFLDRYSGDIQWVVKEFGRRNSSDLELLSTIVYVSRELSQREPQWSWNELVRRVQDIKPRFSEAYIRKQVESLHEKELLEAK